MEQIEEDDIDLNSKHPPICSPPLTREQILNLARFIRNEKALKRKKKKNQFKEKMTKIALLRANQLYKIRIEEMSAISCTNNTDVNGKDSPNIESSVNKAKCSGEEEEFDSNEENAILEEIVQNAKQKCSQRRYSERSIIFFSEIQHISNHAYDLLRSKFAMASRQTISKRLQCEINQRIIQLQDVNEVTQIIHSYRKLYHIGYRNSLKCLISVDAICFSPDVRAKNNRIVGISPSAIRGVELDSLLGNTEIWIEFLSNNIDSFENYAFVFMLQPLNSNYKCRPIHWLKSTKGKANTEIIILLKQLKSILDRMRIPIIGYAFDGDNAYDVMHFEMLKKISPYISSDHILSCWKNKGLLPLVVGDLLHIIKRARYHLTKNKTLVGFVMENHGFNAEDLKSVIKRLPSVIWSNSQLTKMVDELPLKLFSLNNLLQLNLSLGAGYFFPFVIAIIGFSSENLNNFTRRILFEIVLNYFWHYYELMREECDWWKENKVRQKSAKGAKMLAMFSSTLCMHIINTMYA